MQNLYGIHVERSCLIIWTLKSKDMNVEVKHNLKLIKYI